MHRLSRLAVLVLALTSVLPLSGAAAVTVGPPPIVAFEDWAPAACPRPTGADVARSDRIVVHHSHHPTAATDAEVLPALAEMCRIHLARGFDTIGYHYVVDPWGRVYQGRGRLPAADGTAPTSQPEGAHVHGSNPGATGIVFLGDHEDEPPTAAAVDAAVELLAWLVAASGRDPAEQVTIESTGAGTSSHAGHVEVSYVAGHNETNATLCPGRHLIALLDPMRDRVRDRIAGAAPAGTLVATGTVRPAPDGAARVTSLGPIVAMPPPQPALATDAGLLGLLPSAVVLGVLLRLLRPRRSRSVAG